MDIDREYRDKILNAIMDATMRASLADGVALMKTGEICDACLQFMALMMAGSADTQSPTGRRHAIEQLSKKLLRKLVATQAEVAANGWPDRFTNLNANDIH